MAGYFFVDVREVLDAAGLEKYRAAVLQTVEKFGGDYLIVGGLAEVVEGNWLPHFPVLIRFPTIEAAKDWYGSEEYGTLRELRLASTLSDAVFFESVANEFVKNA